MSVSARGKRICQYTVSLSGLSALLVDQPGQPAQPLWLCKQMHLWRGYQEPGFWMGVSKHNLVYNRKSTYSRWFASLARAEHALHLVSY